MVDTAYGYSSESIDDMIDASQTEGFANPTSSGGFFDFLGGLADYATQPGVLLPGIFTSSLVNPNKASCPMSLSRP